MNPQPTPRYRVYKAFGLWMVRRRVRGTSTVIGTWLFWDSAVDQVNRMIKHDRRWGAYEDAVMREVGGSST